MSNEQNEELPTSSANTEGKIIDTTSDRTFAKYRSLIISECGFKITTTESYLKRLQNLRKELTYINETDWMFEPLDKKPSQ
ncbi:uncharacterized protein LOC119672512 [Teleopsis dalmanni]|uniref:uncharacterized protein LOC119672512 n=1 Tax=Teleopsis dalmanni TaxID=139649 RepID=UPI0018CFA4F0|nr:uncharacterized protein LOC119672512 [Teleopsis dalmanni]